MPIQVLLSCFLPLHLTCKELPVLPLPLVTTEPIRALKPDPIKCCPEIRSVLFFPSTGLNHCSPIQNENNKKTNKVAQDSPSTE